MRGVQEGALQSVLSAEIDACAFYESCGYQKTSEPYAEDGVLCVEMTKQLKTAVKEE
jgi:predicted GNAT family N-acyltransferase